MFSSMRSQKDIVLAYDWIEVAKPRLFVADRLRDKNTEFSEFVPIVLQREIFRAPDWTAACHLSTCQKLSKLVNMSHRVLCDQHQLDCTARLKCAIHNRGECRFSVCDADT